MAFGFLKKKKKKEGSHERYYSLKVIEVVNETADAISVVFAQPEIKIEYQSGQFLSLITEINSKSVRRSYSLSSSPYTDKNLAVTIKRIDGGLVSNFLNDSVKVGDVIKVTEPMGHFITEYKESNKRHLIMFGGGSGITPLMSHAKSALVKEPGSIVSLIYANRDIKSIIFKDEFQDFETKHEGRFRVIHILDNAPLEWQGPSGLLNHEMLTDLFERIPNWGIEKTTYIMCGPEGMMNNVETLLAQQNIPAEKIFKESFVAGIINKDDSKDSETEIKEQTVTIIYDDEEFQVKVGAKTTILDAALELDIELPYSCQSGLCTACRGKCVSGSVKMDEEEGLSKAEIEAGYVLPCVAHPLTDDVKIEIG